MQVLQVIIEFIQEKTGVDTVLLNENLLTQIKSFDFMMLILELEQRFSVQLPIESIIEDEITTVTQFASWVDEKID